MRNCLFAALVAACLSNLGHAQTQAQPLLVTNIFGISASWPGECAAGAIDNRSQVQRQNDYSAVYVTSGSGSWSVAVNYSDVSCSGPWTTFGSASQITQSSSPPIAYGQGYHQFIQIAITGNAIVTYSGSKNYFLAAATGSVSFPITCAQGGTGLTSGTSGGLLYFSGGCVLASSGAFGLGLPVIGGGAGSPPTAGSITGNTSKFATWNGGTTSGRCVDTDSNGNLQITAADCNASALPSATGQLQYLRVQPNTGTLTTLQFSPLGLRTVSSDYNFPAQTIGGSITGGVGTSATLTPCPLGVAGADTNHYLYLVGGVGTAEPVLITGGTCASGAATGTVQFTPSNNHSGSWTLSSATSGIQEAVLVACGGSSGTGAGGVYLAPSPSTDIYAVTTVPANCRMSLRGAGMGHTNLVVHGLGTNLFNVPAGASGWIDMGDFLVIDSANTGHTSGSMIQIARSFGTISNIQVSYAYVGIECDGCSGDMQFIGNLVSTSHYGIWLTSGTTQAHIVGGNYSGTVRALSVDSTTVVGLYSSGTLYAISNGGTVSSGAVSLHMNSGPVNEIVFSGGEVDGGAAGGNAIEVAGNGAAYQNNSIQFVGIRVNALGAGAYAISAASKVNGLIVEGCNITTTASGSGGVLLSDVQNAIVAGNKFVTDNTVSYGIAFSGSTNANIQLVNNQIGYELTPPATAISLTTATLVQITGNILKAGTNLVNGAASVTSLVMRNNTGVDDTVPTVASAATLALPLNPVFATTGTTTTTAFTVPFMAGFQWTFIPGGAEPFTAGGNVGNSCTTTAGNSYTLTWDGTHVWIAGKGC